MEHKKQAVEKWGSVRGWLAPGLDGKRRAQRLDLLKQFAEKRGLANEGNGWITAAIEVAALEHPELSEHERPGRPSYGHREHKRLLEAATKIKDKLKSEGKRATAAAIARELARVDYVQTYKREPSADALKAQGKSMEVRIRKARRFVDEYLSSMRRNAET